MAGGAVVSAPTLVIKPPAIAAASVNNPPMTVTSRT
jgi:hypothetical protein